MGTKFNVQLVVEVDVDGWKVEHGHGHVGQALREVLSELREPGWYLNDRQWLGFATVHSAKAQVDLGINGEALGKALEAFDRAE